MSEDQLENFLREFVVPQKKIAREDWTKDYWFLPNKTQEVSELADNKVWGVNSSGRKGCEFIVTMGKTWCLYGEKRKDRVNIEINKILNEYNEIQTKMKDLESLISNLRYL